MTTALALGRRAAVPPSNLPPRFTSFIGRETELDDLTRLVLDPTCRLITVTGQGGVGKSRLAVEVAQRLLQQAAIQASLFIHGIWFVPLQAVDSAEHLVSAITDALQLPPPGASSAHDHLLSCLHDLHVLVILDSFEHLWNCAGLLSEILTVAPDVRLLVTSREALNLEAEWRYPLDGLPVAGPADASLLPSAERLFAERARRVFPAFNAAAELEDVRHICRLVEGVPLAIELAAAWTRALPCAAIAAEIAGNLAFLSTSERNVPEPHRSMQAVFDRSWQMLSPEERLVFARLTVFRGGFSLQAARAVAKATVSSLAALLDKSLLRRAAGDRYHMHDLLRQYAAEQLQQLPGETAATQERHCIYYADFLAQRAEDISGRRQRLALSEIAGELENVRAASQYALEHKRIADIQRGAYTFYLFHDCRSRYREGADLFEWAVQQLDDPSGKRFPTVEAGPTLAELLVCLGWLCIRLGELPRACRVLDRSQAILTRLAAAPRPGPGTDPLVALGTLANVLGDYAEAARLGEEARRRSTAQHDLGNLMYAYYVLANAACARGQYVEASRCGALACELADQLQDRWFLAYLVADLGNIARMTGNYAEALRQYQLAYIIRDEFGDPEGVAVALVRLGQVSLLQGELERAQGQFRQGLSIYSEIGDRGGEATALQGLGMAAIVAGSYPSAAHHLHSALRLAAAIGFASRTNSILAAVADLFLSIGKPLQAAVLLVPVLRDPVSDRETSDRARLLLERCKEQLAPDQFATATYGRQAFNLPALLAALQLLAAGTAHAPAITPPLRSAGQVTAGSDAVLVEPLSARELAVLHLVAAGQSNQDIAAQLVITPGTAKWYVSQILAKLGVHSRTKAIARARELGLLV